MKKSGISQLKFKPWGYIIGVVLLFLVISLAYFTPAAFEGRVLFQADGAAASGTGRDVVEYKAETGERSYWTGSLFGGMPTYQISPSYPSAEGIKVAQNLYRLRLPFLNFLPGDSYLIFMLLIGFYIFMRSWGLKRLLSIGGAIMWAFSSYFLILIDAGHIWKLLALTYIPPTIAGLVLVFHRRKYLLGFFVTGLFTALQIYSNHIQMSYYFAFVMVAMVVAWGIEAAHKKEWLHFAKATGTVLAAGLVGIAINGTSLYHTYQYSQETMRGGREITVLDQATDKQATTTGLDHAYITQWSYGIDEMLTFLIPDAKGGASGYIGIEEAQNGGVSDPQLLGIVAQQNRYWGDQPFTAGPVYVGAIVLLLALFGMIVAKGPMKWGLVVVTLLTIMLSWGHNLMWLSELFINHFPLYDKFRTPSSILVVAEFTLPLFAIWALYLLTTQPQLLKEHKKAAIISVALTLGVALLMWVAPSLSGGFLSRAEEETFSTLTAEHQEVALVRSALEQVREGIFKADALRTIIVLLFGIGILYFYQKEKLNKKWMLSLLFLLILVDLWSVDKRYLNDEKYLPQRSVQAKVSHTTEADKIILADTTQFRVLNLAVNTFNDATTSYNHRSVGGYHAAKLQRYQDLIEGYLVHQDLNILRALNTKYYIIPDSLGREVAVADPDTYGDAWFVSKAQKVDTPDDEFTTIGKVSLQEVAVVGSDFAKHLPTTITPDSTAQIKLTSYSPNKVTYQSSNAQEGLAVFSEIYYPHGWHATIDGAPAEILRADYLLRALVVPAGQHQIEFVFDPKTLHATELVANIGNLLLLLAGIGTVIYYIRQRKHGKSDTPSTDRIDE